MTAAGVDEGPLFNPTDPSFCANPYPHYQRLREEAPIHWSSQLGNGAWVFARYRDCLEILRDSHLGPSLADPRVPRCLEGGAAARLYPHLSALAQGSGHTEIQAVLARALSTPVLVALGPRVEVIANDLLDALPGHREMDLISSFAFRLPVRVASELLGIPPRDRPTLERWMPDLVRILEPESQPPAALQQCHAACAGLLDYFERSIHDRDNKPGTDWITALARLGTRVNVRRDELLAAAIHLLSTGFQTTVGLIGNGALALIRHRDQLAELASRPALASTAVEECIRYDSPVQLIGLVARSDFELRGVRIERGERLWTLVASANRDAEVYEEPWRFDPSRGGPPHLSFGFGDGGGPDLRLARMEARIALAVLARRLPALRLAAGRRDRRVSRRFRMLERLPVTY